MEMRNVKAISIPFENTITGYTRVEYIEGTGTQYFDTGFYPKPTTCVEIDFQFTSTTVQQRLFGITGDLVYQCYINGSGNWAYGYQNTSGNWINTGIAADTNRHKIALDGKNKVFKLDGNGMELLGSPTNTANRTLYIFTRNEIGDVKGSFKLFDCKIYDDGTLIRHYVPAIRDSDSIPGVYDLVNNEFIASASGTFVAGNNLTEIGVSKIEDENNNMLWGSDDAYPFRQLECLNMYGAYIDTKFKPSKHFYYLNCKFPSSYTGDGNWAFLYGTAGYSTRWWFGMYSNSTSASMSQVIYQRLKNNGNTPVTKLSSLNPNTMYQLRIRNYNAPSNNSSYWYALQDIDNSSEVYGHYYSGSTYSMNLTSMPTIQINRQAYYANSTTTTPTYSVPGNGSYSVYRYFIRETDGASPIIFDAYPVQRKSDGVCGLYDIYGSAFYPCQGDTSSTCGGAIVSEYFEPSSLL